MDRGRLGSVTYSREMLIGYNKGMCQVPNHLIPDVGLIISINQILPAGDITKHIDTLA